MNANPETAKLREALRQIAEGSWNHGNAVPGRTVMDFARSALSEAGKVEESQFPRPTMEEIGKSRRPA